MKRKYNPVINLGDWAKPIPKNRRCMKCKSSKTRIEKDGRRHWMRAKEGDYKGQLLCNKCFSHEYGKNVIYGHRRIYEKHYNVCLLRWTEIRFINEDKTDKHIENLETVTRGTHANTSKGYIPKDRHCAECGAKRSSTDWHKRKNEFICTKCHCRAVRRDRKLTKDRELYYSLEDKKKKLITDTSYRFKPPHTCAICGSTTTKNRSKSKGGKPDWYRLKKTGKGHLKEGEEVQCFTCYNRQHHRFRISTGRQIPTGRLIIAWQKALKGMFPRRSTAAYRRALRRIKNPSMKPFMAREIPKICIDCDGTSSSKNSKGCPNWYKTKISNRKYGYLDAKCYMRRRRLSKAMAVIPPSRHT